MKGRTEVVSSQSPGICVQTTCHCDLYNQYSIFWTIGITIPLINKEKHDN